MKSTAGWIGQVVSWFVIFAMLAVLAVCVLIPRLGGGTPYTILTGSMKSTLPQGTLVVVKPTPMDQIEIGDVITFQIKPGEPAVATHRVTARTVADDGTPRFFTKGDDNNAPDREQVRAEQIRGKLWYSVPVIGRANTLLDKSQHQAAVVTAGSGLLLYAAFMLVSAATDSRSPRASRRKTEVAA
ncbi:signal peptidase I [Aeromicrobium sp. NPDC092404]|uniref:signal peptidase I n=1 Tax=Aeromicrobium sp. NPDC092404 TaxID=3154976 RepID=UPI0034204699